MTSIGLWLYYFQIKSNKTVMPKVRTTSTGAQTSPFLTSSGRSIGVTIPAH